MKKIYYYSFSLLFLFACNNKEYIESEKKFKGYFWNTQNNVDDYTSYDSAQFYLNKMKHNSNDDYLINIWKLRLYLKKGLYDSILLKSKLIETKNNYDINFINGVAHKAKGDTTSSIIYLNKALSSLNCEQNLDDKCIIIKTLITNNFDLMNKKQKQSQVLYRIYNNSYNNTDGLIEAINDPFNDNLFILTY